MLLFNHLPLSFLQISSLILSPSMQLRLLFVVVVVVIDDENAVVATVLRVESAADTDACADLWQMGPSFEIL